MLPIYWPITSASISSLCRHCCSIITSPHFLLCSHLRRVISQERAVSLHHEHVCCVVGRTFSFSINKNCEYVRAHVSTRLWLQYVTVLTLYDIHSLLSRVWPLSYMLLSCVQYTTQQHVWHCTYVLYIIPNVSNNQGQTNPLFHLR